MNLMDISNMGALTAENALMKSLVVPCIKMNPSLGPQDHDEKLTSYDPYDMGHIACMMQAASQLAYFLSD